MNEPTGGDTWREVLPLFDRWLSADADAQRALLAEVAAARPALHSRLLAMIEADRAAQAARLSRWRNCAGECRRRIDIARSGGRHPPGSLGAARNHRQRRHGPGLAGHAQRRPVQRARRGEAAAPRRKRCPGRCPLRPGRRAPRPSHPSAHRPVARRRAHGRRHALSRARARPGRAARPVVRRPPAEHRSQAAPLPAGVRGGRPCTRTSSCIAT